MGVLLSHEPALMSETDRAYSVVLRTAEPQPDGTILQGLYPIWVPKSLTAQVDGAMIEVRTWFFKKALAHLEDGSRSLLRARGDKAPYVHQPKASKPKAPKKPWIVPAGAEIL